MPFSWSGVELYATGATAVRVTLTPLGANEFSLVVTDLAGSLVASVDSLTLRPLAAGRAAAKPLHHVEWVAAHQETIAVPFLADVDTTLPGAVAVRISTDVGEDVPRRTRRAVDETLALVRRWTQDDRYAKTSLVIVTSGAWAGKLLPEFAGRLEVKRRVVGWFETSEPKLLPVICADNDVGVFGMPAPRGRYKLGLHAIGGATDPDNVREPDEADATLLSEHATPLLPKHNPKPVRMQRCLYTVTPDENFMITPSKANERVLMFSACSGHGFKYAPVFGELAQEWLAGVPSRELEALMHPGSNINRLGAAKT